MTIGSNGSNGSGRSGRPLAAIVLAATLVLVIPVLAIPASVSAQMFTDRPPPVPPGLVPEAPAGPAMNLAPPSGPASMPNLPAPVTQPPPPPTIANVPPAALAPLGAAAPGQAVLALTARYGKDLPVINNGLVWRVYSDRPDESGTFKLIREDRGATPNIVLPPG